MTTVISISEEAKAFADAMIRDGKATSFDHLMQAVLQHDPLAWIDEPLDLDDLSPEDRAAVEEGLADIEAGRTIPMEEAFAKVRARIDALRR